MKNIIYSNQYIRPFVAIALLLVWPHNADAYLDPGTGSYVIQLIIAGFLGGIFALKIFWKQINLFFIKIFSRNHSNEKSKNQ